jgi:hypothetical protein
MELKKTFGNMALLGLFIFGIFFFIISVQTDNNVAIKITDNTIINRTYGDLSSELGSTQGKTQGSMDTFGTTTPTQEFGEIEITSIVSPTRTIKTLIWGVWSSITVLPQSILGVSPIIASVISSILIIGVILGIWAIWKGVVS